ncbi:hypothetical protein GPK34_00790 [Secundilactobacillus kimchicus]|uniref:hypothetical protein n=1 Tax=Secundilactobacillus kimchicus TaxID=528209 RepID=UPI001C018C2B|nr:hypothetical protein [Secundilactobacillus kimchicus]MBT9670575.1 hypothetical protein [Secundilactobacillus kimchicus]
MQDNLPNDPRARKELERFMQKSQVQNESEADTPTTPVGQPAQQAPAGNSANEVQELKQMVQNLSKQVQKYQKNEQQEADFKHNVESEKAVQDIINGNPENFVEDYTFNVSGSDDPVKLHVEMRALTAADIRRVENLKVEMTSGRSQYYDAEFKELVEAIATIEVTKEDVPDWVTSDNLYRTDIPIMIYEDYTAWWNSFRNSRRR